MPRPKKDPIVKVMSPKLKTAKRNNTQFDPRTGKLVNTDCPICVKMGRDPRGHQTKAGQPSCRGHKHKLAAVCKRLPMAGQGVCMMHGGKVAHNMEAGRKRLALVRINQELDALGGSLDVDPAIAMLAMVREAAYNVAFLRKQLELLRQGFESQPGAGDGIIGRVDPETWEAKEHVLVVKYDNERDRLVRYSKMCRDAGVEERRVRIEEEQGRWLTQTLDLLLERLGLTEQQQNALPTIMHEVIDVLELDTVPEYDEDEDEEDDQPVQQASGVIPAPTPPPL